MITINTDAWHWPQWTVLILQAMNFLLTAMLHGEPREGRYSVSATLVWIVWTTIILACGGFFG
jgi:hypothetical protein